MSLIAFDVRRIMANGMALASESRVNRPIGQTMGHSAVTGRIGMIDWCLMHCRASWGRSMAGVLAFILNGRGTGECVRPLQIRDPATKVGARKKN
jgi:hypothetical protein